nr:MAG TPA: hypothetical protein [Bacteriophage sp.]
MEGRLLHWNWIWQRSSRNLPGSAGRPRMRRARSGKRSVRRCAPSAPSRCRDRCAPV